MAQKTGALIFDETADRYDIRFDIADYYGGLHCGECMDVFTGGKWKPTRMDLLIEQLVPNMWQVQSANIYWHMTNGLTTKQMYSALQDILKETIGGHLENTGRSDIGNAYDSVLAMLQLGLLVTSFLLLFVSVLGQINIGLSSLEQRTHELLIRRAIGASRANIVTLVLGTQLIISIFVCIASILLSLLIVEGISVLLPPDSPITAPSYPIFSAVIAVITSVIVALLGGLLPAIKAAKLEPALALR